MQLKRKTESIRYAIDKDGYRIQIGSKVTLWGANSDGTPQVFLVTEDESGKMFLYDIYRKTHTRTSLWELALTELVCFAFPATHKSLK